MGVAAYFEIVLPNTHPNDLSNEFGFNRFGCEVQTVYKHNDINRKKKIRKFRTIQCFTNGADACWMIVDAPNNSGIGGWKHNPYA